MSVSLSHGLRANELRLSEVSQIDSFNVVSFVAACGRAYSELPWLLRPSNVCRADRPLGAPDQASAGGRIIPRQNFCTLNLLLDPPVTERWSRSVTGWPVPVAQRGSRLCAFFAPRILIAA